MDHAEVREQLELAAVEPGGLERLAAGDTADAAAIAGHLAGCPSCTEEARRLARVAPLVHDAALSVPPDDLKERTLSLVRAVGRPRGAAGGLPAEAAAVAGSAPVRAGSAPVAVTPVVEPIARRRAVRWPMAIAAVIVLALFVGGGVFAVGLTQRLQAESSALAELNTATLRVSARPDATLVELVGGSEGPAKGTLLFSPATAELVVSAPSLTEPGGGQRYACWITRPDGSRARMGDMEFGGGIAYWTGWDDKLRDAGPGTTFGVTLVGADGRPVDGDTLTGTVSQD